MGSQPVEGKSVIVPVDRAARSKVIANIRSDIEKVRAQATSAVDKLANARGTPAGIDVHGKTDTHIKVDGHVKSDVEIPDPGQSRPG